MAKAIVKITSITDGVQTITQAHQHRVITDEPEKVGGKDQGPNPLEVLLAALAGCENVLANMIAKEIDFDLQGISFKIKAEFDPLGLRGEPSVRPYFETVYVQADVATNEDQSRITELQTKVDNRCPVISMMRAAGINMVAEWRKSKV
jgi:putative redox protein